MAVFKAEGPMFMRVSEYHGCKRYDFCYAGRDCTVVVPQNPREDKRWIWKAEFFEAFPYADIAMLHKGFYLTIIKIPDMYGSDAATGIMHEFQEFLIREFELYRKAILFGFSRGGLYALYYAARYPGLAEALYLDAPVVDIRSWPGGMGRGIGAQHEWSECKEIYGIDEHNLAEYGEKLDIVLRTVAGAQIPLIVVYGDADKVVVYEENAQKLVNLYRERKSKCEVIEKKGVGHHPHSLEDPTPITDFLCSLF